MVFLLKTKTSKKDVPIDRLPFMISEKTDCLGSRFFRITTYYLLPLRISFSMLSTCCPCTFHLAAAPAHFIFHAQYLLPISAAYRAHKLPHSRLICVSQLSDIS